MTNSRPCVLVSHELNIYAEALVGSLAAARPCLDVHHVTDAQLDDAVEARAGSVVVSGRLSPAIEAHAGGWLLYYPEQANVAVVGEDPDNRRIENPEFPDILSAIDALIARLSRLVQGRSTSGECGPAPVPSVAEA